MILNLDILSVISEYFVFNIDSINLTSLNQCIYMNSKYFMINQLTYSEKKLSILFNYRIRTLKFIDTLPESVDKIINLNVQEIQFEDIHNNWRILKKIQNPTVKRILFFNCDCYIRASYITHFTRYAALLIDACCVMIPFSVYLIGKSDDLLWTCFYAQSTTFAIIRIHSHFWHN